METIPFDQTQRDVADIRKDLKEVKYLLTRTTESNLINEPEEPIDIKDVSRITGKTVPTIYGYVHRNTIPHSKKGNRLYFFRSEIIDWIKTGKRKSNSEIEIETEARLLKNKKG